jgi:starch-binding outer membrane protein, SusD/RagB family
MKSIITKLVMSSALIASITSCSEFLEKEPLSEGTEAIVF